MYTPIGDIVPPEKPRDWEKDGHVAVPIGSAKEEMREKRERKTRSDSLLLDEDTLRVIPTLAVLIGLHEAIVVQQIHFWLKNNHTNGRNFIDGRYWSYNSIANWRKTTFPFWQHNYIQKEFAKLREPFSPKSGKDTRIERGPLLLIANYNKLTYDRTIWYSIDYEELVRIGILHEIPWWCDIPPEKVKFL